VSTAESVIVVMLAVGIILLALVLMALMAAMRPAPRPAPLPARLPVAARRPAVVIDVEPRPIYGRQP
jgi:hypothetical protein